MFNFFNVNPIMDKRVIRLNCVKLFLLLTTHYFVVDGKFVVKRVEYCNRNANYPIKVQCDIINRNTGQYANGNVTLPMPVDPNMDVLVEISYVVSDRRMRIMKAKEKNVCDAMNRYLGEIWYGMAQNVGIEPKKCPIPKGHYELKNYRIGLERVPLQSIPFGDIYLETKAVDNRNNKELLCMMAEVENQK